MSGKCLVRCRSTSKKYVQLANGFKMPSFGLGTFTSTPEEIELAVSTAIEVDGYRHIDTAFLYENEKAIGDTLKRILDAGKVKREELFIVTKLPLCAMRASEVELFLRESLRRLQLDYVDLYLIHFPCGTINRGFDATPARDEDGRVLMDSATDHVALWKKMEEMVDKKLTKSIGLSNFNIRQIQRVLDIARIKPANLQVECHAYFQQTELYDFCRKNGISFTAYAPLGSPGYGTFSQNVTGDVIEGIPLLSNPSLKAIADRHNKSVSQVLLRWLVDRGMIVIPKSTNPKRIHENFDIWNFELSEGEVKTIVALDRKERIFKMAGGAMNGISDHPEYPF